MWMLPYMKINLLRIKNKPFKVKVKGMKISHLRKPKINSTFAKLWWRNHFLNILFWTCLPPHSKWPLKGSSLFLRDCELKHSFSTLGWNLFLIQNVLNCKLQSDGDYFGLFLVALFYVEPLSGSPSENRKKAKSKWI